MALHAMRDGGEIEALLHLVAHHGFGERLLAARNHVLDLRHLVDRIRHLVAHRLDGAQIGNDRIEIAIGHDVVEAGRHDHRDMHTVRPYAGAHQRLDLRIGPAADAGFLVRRNVRRGHLERRLVPGQAAGKILAGDCRRRALRRVAIAAGHESR